MAINVKGSKGVAAQRAAEIREALDLPHDAEVAVGATKTYVALTGGARLTLPEGIGTITGEGAREYVAGLSGGANQGGEHAFTDAPGDDEAWAASVAPKVLPPSRPLSEVTKLYERVQPQSPKTKPYVSCFIGSNLIGACRVNGSKFDVKFRGRSTVHPSAEVIQILEALNVRQVKDEYVTAHVALPGEGTPCRATVSAVLGGFYAALREHLTSPFPDVAALTEAP